ncbi:MAG: hypothetical protein PHF31_08820 [Methylobacter sp.]|nr:hypothetical protein [Methylobacter sp.]
MNEDIAGAKIHPLQAKRLLNRRIITDKQKSALFSQFYGLLPQYYNVVNAEGLICLRVDADFRYYLKKWIMCSH